MKKFTVLPGSRISPDVTDGPGWTDVDVDGGYSDSNGTYVRQGSSSLGSRGNVIVLHQNNYSSPRHSIR